MFYAQECYDYNYFDECERICSTLKQVPLSDVQDTQVNILLAKSIFGIYTTESRLYWSNTSIPREVEESKYQKAKKIIACLHKENVYQMDKELAMFLDISMMECVQGKNRLHETGLCMLCLQHCKKLIRSHIIPRSILQNFRRATQRYNGNKVFQISTDPMKYFTDKTLTRNLLCENCESLLNIHGEQDFCEKFFKKIYNLVDPECLSAAHDLHYGDWLYHFFMGLIFRGIAAFIGIPNFVNDKEFHELFSICRKFLLKLPVEVLPDLHMFINPTFPPTEYRMQWNHATLVGPATFHAACNLLSDEAVSHSRKGHFILAKIGIINVIVKLSPALDAKLSLASVINPLCGIFKIPADEERLSLLPQGIKDVYTVISQENRKMFQDSIFKKDPFAPKRKAPNSDIDIKFRNNFGLIRASDTDSLEFQEKIEGEGGLILKCLPSQFVLDQKSGEVQFPFPFVKLLHYHTEFSDPKCAITIFMGISSALGVAAEPFVVYHEAVPEQVLYFGYTFNLEDFTVKDYISQLTLQDYPESIAKRVSELSKDLLPILIPTVLERCGFVSVKSLVYHYKYK